MDKSVQRVEVLQGEYGYASREKGHKYLSTTNVTTCVVVIGYQKEKKRAFLFHLDRNKRIENFKSVLKELVDCPQAKEEEFTIELHGGLSDKTRNRIKQILHELKEEGAIRFNIEKEVPGCFWGTGYEIIFEENNAIKECTRRRQARKLSLSEFISDIKHTLSCKPLKKAPHSAW